MNYQEYKKFVSQDRENKFSSHREFRSQLLDMVKSTPKYIAKRPTCSRVFSKFAQGTGDFSLEELLKECKHYKVSPEDCFIEIDQETDYDGYIGFICTLFVSTPVTDTEYYEYLSGYLCPSEYQITLARKEREEYNQYLALKAKFEGGN